MSGAFDHVVAVLRVAERMVGELVLHIRPVARVNHLHRGAVRAVAQLHVFWADEEFHLPAIAGQAPLSGAKAPPSRVGAEEKSSRAKV